MNNEDEKIRQVIETLFVIQNKRGEFVPFILNNIQKIVLSSICSFPRTTILKFRQGGVTSIVMAYFLVKCLSSSVRCVMLAHDKDHTEKLLFRAQLMLKHLRGPKAMVSRLNEEEIVFPKTDSTFYIGTAGSKQFGRSDTITHLHCSELAFWKDPQELVSGLYQAVPHDSGKVVEETTGNGWGSWHHRRWVNAKQGKGRLHTLFLPWNLNQEYRSKNPLLYPLTEEETFLQIQHNLDEEQIQWRREKIEEFEGDETRFKQEYPLTEDEAFRLTGGSIFPNLQVVADPRWKQNRLEGHPSSKYTYIIGADVSGGTGNDYSSIQVLCLEHLEQVYVYKTNTLDPLSFAELLVKVGKEFHEAYINVESNQHGLSVLAFLKRVYPPHKLYRRKLSSSLFSIPGQEYGFRTLKTTKPYLVNIAQNLIKQGLIIHDLETCEELKGFVESEEGRLEGTTKHDDNAIALMLACLWVVRLSPFHASSSISSSLDDSSKEKKFVIKFEDIFKEKKKGLLGDQLNKGERYGEYSLRI